jgi:hypothetical protein
VVVGRFAVAVVWFVEAVVVSLLWSSVPVKEVRVVGAGCGGGWWMGVVVCGAGIGAGGVVGGCVVAGDGGGIAGGVGCGVGMHCGGGWVGGVFCMGAEASGIVGVGVGNGVGGVVLAASDSLLLSIALTISTPAFCLTIWYFHLSNPSHLGFLRPSYHLYQVVAVCNVLPCGKLPIYSGIPSLIGRCYTVVYLYVSGWPNIIIGGWP